MLTLTLTDTAARRLRRRTRQGRSGPASIRFARA